MKIKIVYKIYKKWLFLIAGIFITLILATNFLLINHLLTGSNTKITYIPLISIATNLIIISILIITFIKYFNSHIREFFPFMKSIAENIIKSSEQNDSNNAVIEIPVQELIIKTEKIIANYSDYISKIESIILKLKNEIENNSEVLTFLTAKSDEHTKAAEGDMDSIQRISEMTNDIIEGAEDQHISLGLLVARMLDFTRIIESISNELTRQIEIIDNISEKAESGNQSLMLMNETMEKLKESSEKMTESLRLITEISDSINLLSLNAAIESARAGEQGRGFAVVADEISKLAEQTALTIKDVNAIIKNNEAGINTGLEHVKQTADIIFSMTEGVINVREMMHNAYGKMDFQIKNNYIVNEESEKVKTGTNMIANAISNQKTAVDDLVISLKDISEMSQYASYLAKQVVKHFSDIIEGVDDINKLISEKKLLFYKSLT